jgi:hypothetical protein
MEEPGLKKSPSFKTHSTVSDTIHMPNKTSLIWSILVFSFNSYILLTNIYWVCTGQMPGQNQMFFDVTVEVILITELLIRVFLKWKLPKHYPELNFLHVRYHKGFQNWAVSLIGSIPIVMIYQAVGSTNAKLFARLMSIKFLRCFEIWYTVQKAEEILFYRKFSLLLILKFMKDVSQLFVITHFAACFWILSQSEVGSVTFYGDSDLNYFKDSN